MIGWRTRAFPRNKGLVQGQAMAGDKLWVAGVELAEPASPRRKPRTGGVDLRSSTPATRRCYPHLNQAKVGQITATT